MQFCVGSINGLAETAKRTRAEYYDFALNTTSTQKSTDGSSSIQFIITILNTGNSPDTITLFSELVQITNCDNPDFNEWSYVLEPSVIKLDPSYTESVTLTVSTACSCQEGCKAEILVTGKSGSNPDLSKSITLFTIRGAAKPPPGDPGVVIDINYNQYTTKLTLEKQVTIDVEVINTQNTGETIFIWVYKKPDTWSVSVTPSDFSMSRYSRKVVKLNLLIPQGVLPDTYRITLLAQSQESPNINDKDTIKIPIKPDVIIQDVVFSKPKPREGENVKLTISVKNIGLAKVENITLVIYDDLNYTQAHTLNTQVIELLQPNQTEEIVYTWHPKEGDYNLAFRIDPENNLNELRSDNNIRLDPISVGEKVKKNGEDFLFLYTILSVIILVVVCLIMFYHYSRQRKVNDERDMNSDKISERKEPLPHRSKRDNKLK
jgi:uncharacterized membrane protein